MASKKRKKIRHTKLVLPGEQKAEQAAAADRMGRTASTPPAHSPQVSPEQKPSTEEKQPQATAPSEADAQKMQDDSDSSKDGQELQTEQNDKGSAQKKQGTADGQSSVDEPRPKAPQDTQKKRQDEKKPAGKKRKRRHLFSGVKLSAPTAGKQAQADEQAQEDVDEPYSNLIMLPKRKKNKLSPAKRKRRRRRIRIAVALFIFIAGFLFYQTSSYLTAATFFSDVYEDVRIAAWGGEGFPMDFALNGFIKAEPMGSGAFAALGERDAAVVSSAGRETFRTQHNYASPGMSAGNSRMVVYNRGGREYTIESRAGNIAKITTLQDILFCEMSPGGWLAQVTTSRFSSTMTVMDTTYNTSEPNFTFEIVDETPILADFHVDNRNIVLGCISSSGGTMGSTLYMLNVGSSEVQAEVRVEGALLLQAQFLSGNRIVAVYDSFTALYDASGNELARYDYDTRRILTSYVSTEGIALAFGSAFQEQVQVVRIDTQLRPLYEVQIASSSTPSLLIDDDTYVLAAGEVMHYGDEGVLINSEVPQQKGYALVQGDEPLVICAGSVLALSDVFDVSQGSGTSSDVSAEVASSTLSSSA